MSKSEFEDEVLIVLIKWIVGVIKHGTINELGPVDYRGSNWPIFVMVTCLRVLHAQFTRTPNYQFDDLMRTSSSSNPDFDICILTRY
jgi:hypothetical protein